MIDLGQPTVDKQKQPSNRYLRLWLAIAAIVVLLIAFDQLVVKKAFEGWGKEKIEGILTAQLKRKVIMGRVSWGLSLYGGALNTDSLEIHDPDGEVFLRSKDARITVAIMPLLSGQFLPRHVDVHSPYLHLVRYGRGEWNYSDIPKLPPLKDLTHFQLVDGTIALVDRSGLKDPDDRFSTVLKNVDCKIERPFLNRDWPFSIHAEIEHPDYTTKIAMSGRGKGRLDDWAINSQAFDLKAEQLNIHDFDRFFGAIPEASGPVDIEISGSGVPLSGFRGKGKIKTPGYSVSVDNIEFDGSLKRVVEIQQGATGTDGNTIDAILKEMKAALNFKNGDVKVEGTQVSLKSVNGKLRFGDGKMWVDELRGKFENSGFAVTGTVTASGEADLKYHGTSIDIDTVKRAIKEMKLHAPPVVNEPYFGTVAEADVVLSGQLKEPRLSLTAVPRDLYFEKSGHRYFVITGGHVAYDGKRCQLQDLVGQLGRGRYKLRGECGVTAGDPLKVDFEGDDIDIADVRELTALSTSEGEFKKTLAQVEGSIRRSSGRLDGSLNQPHIRLQAEPYHLYYVGASDKRTLQLTGGILTLDGTETAFNKVKGNLGNGTFNLDGVVDTNQAKPTNLKLSARNLDLSNVSLAMGALKIHSPLLAKSLLTGTVKDVSMSAAGQAQSVEVSMTAHPQDIVFEPSGPSQALHIRSGTVTYKQDRFELADVEVKGAHGSLHTDLVVEKLSSDPTLRFVKVKTGGLSLSDLNACLTAPRTPPVIRDKYTKLLASVQLIKPVGSVKGKFEVKVDGSHFAADGWMNLQNVGCTIAGYSLNSINGSLGATEDAVQFKNITGAISKSTFAVDGDVSNYSDPDRRTWKCSVIGAADLPEVISAFRLSKDAAVTVVSSIPLTVRVNLAGPENDLKGSYLLKVPPQSEFSLDSAIGLVKKPAGVAASLTGSAEIKAGTIVLPNSVIDVAGREAEMTGSLKPTRPMPLVNLKVSLPTGTNIHELIALLPEKSGESALKNISGEISGDIQLKGPINIPEMKGSIKISKVSLPSYFIKDASGDLVMADWVSTAGNPNNTMGGIYAPIKVNIHSFSLKKLSITNIQGSVIAQASREGEKLTFNNMSADLAEGKVTANGSLEPNKPATVTMHIIKCDANQVLTRLFDAPDEVTGTLSARADFSASLKKGGNLIDELSGGGRYYITNGRVSRFSLLQRRISQAHLIQSGPLNFNLNDLLASVAPVKEGNFKTFKGRFSLDNGKLRLPFVEFSGDELRLRLMGMVNLDQQLMHLEAAGLLPRVNKHEPFQTLSINSLLSSLNDIPLVDGRLPIPQQPRAFAFKIVAPTNNPHKVTGSIYKTFHWLPNKRTATPYPELVALDGISDDFEIK